MTLESAGPSKGDILIVDDTPDNLRLLSMMLTRRGYEVRKAINGQMALTSVGADCPDLILLDIKMPLMSGYEVCERLKADDASREIPVIFISALDDVLDKVKAFSVGGVDYITKPFQEAEVLARVENQLRLRHLQEQLLQQNHQLQQLNDDLLRSNRELEQFAYVVSHDLQQPLQSITGFVKLIALKYEATLDEGLREYLNRINDAGSRMQRLIQDILAYSRLGQHSQDFQVVDCSEVLRQVLNNLESAIATSHAQLTCQALPTVWGHESQLVQVFQNLVGNAIKFSRSEVPPQVTISVGSTLEGWLFRIQDNGIGIPAENLTRVFDLFHRGNLQKQYAGTGIGLATCKKIIENHGGAIWIESEPDQGGTTFLFTLPAPPPHPSPAILCGGELRSASTDVK